MSNYNRVLIPIDLTLGTGALSPAVQQIVDTSEAEITLLHVVDSQSRLGTKRPHHAPDDRNSNSSATGNSAGRGFPAESNGAVPRIAS